MRSKQKWSEESVVIYRHHPVDRAAAVVAVAVAVLLAARLWLPDFTQYEPLALVSAIGVACVFAAFFALAIWGILNEHRLDAAIDRTIAQGDENLKRARRLSARLSERLNKQDT